MDHDNMNLVEARIKELNPIHDRSYDFDFEGYFQSISPKIKKKRNIYPHTWVPPELDGIIPDEDCLALTHWNLRMKFYRREDTLASCVVRQAKAGNPRAKQFLKTIY